MLYVLVVSSTLKELREIIADDIVLLLLLLLLKEKPTWYLYGIATQTIHMKS